VAGASQLEWLAERHGRMSDGMSVGEVEVRDVEDVGQLVVASDI
jgi:hypothetical protein